MGGTSPVTWRCGARVLELGAQPLVMGIVNVTPDSFSDGGQHFGERRGVTHALRLVDDGADIVDVGGQSTRPGADDVSAQDEWRRVRPALSELAETSALVSIDTMKASIAHKAIAAGADIVNDVTAALGDPDMVALLAEGDVGVVLMHMRGTPKTMQSQVQYEDVVDEVLAALEERVEALVHAGVHPERIAIDPGIGFAKTADQSFTLLRRIDRLRSLGRPVVVGASRKSFLASVVDRDAADRDSATLATSVWSALAGAHVLRVHDVRATVDALAVLERIELG